MLRGNIGLAVGCLLIFSGQVDLEASAEFIPGEILLRFATETEDLEVVKTARQAAPVDLKLLAPVLFRLSQLTGVPLKVSSIGGGLWMLLSVDHPRLEEQIGAVLAQREEVEKVDKSGGPPTGSVGSRPSPRWRITFATNTFGSEAVRRKLDEGSAQCFDVLLEKLSKDLKLPVRASVEKERTVEFRLDLNQLTLQLIERLKALPEVESAQPNYILTLQ